MGIVERHECLESNVWAILPGQIAHQESDSHFGWCHFHNQFLGRYVVEYSCTVSIEFNTELFGLFNATCRQVLYILAIGVQMLIFDCTRQAEITA